MAIDRRRFLGVFLVSNVLFILVIAGILVADTGLAVPLAGVGGFVVQFDQLEGQGLQQNPTLAETEDCDAYPAGQTQMEEAEIQGLHLYRDIHVPGTGDTMRFNVEADNVEINGLTQEFTRLEGDISFPEGQEISHQSSGDIEDQFGISGDAVVIHNGRIRAQSQFTDSISLTGSTISMDINPDDTWDHAETPCLDEADGGNGSDGDGDNGTGNGDGDGVTDNETKGDD